MTSCRIAKTRAQVRRGNDVAYSPPAKRGREACSKEVRFTARAPAIALLRSAVPLPRYAGQDEECARSAQG